MVQARLPDINTEMIMYRREAMVGFKNKDYNNMFGAAFSLNACLPKDYQVKISNSEYYAKTHEDDIVNCLFCKSEHLYKDIKIVKSLLSNFEQMIARKKFKAVWKCSDCGEENLLYRTEIIHKVKKQPYFIQVVPEAPSRKDGLMDRSKYYREVTKWFWQFMNELAFQESRFREEYVPKGNEGEEMEFELGVGEELDQ